MPIPPILAEFDWNSVFVVLVPLLYFAMQFFGGKKEDAEKQTPKGKGGESDPSAQERLRRVQEEIRRKIAERQEQVRRVMEGEDPREQPPPPPPQPYDPNRPEWAQRRETPSSSRPATSTLPRSSQSSRAPEASLEPPPVPTRPVESALDRQLREQRERLARAKREREAAFAKASGVLDRAMGGASHRRAHASHAPAGSARQAVLKGLQSPQAARNAIVLSEILGPPRATREFGLDR